MSKTNRSKPQNQKELEKVVYRSSDQTHHIMSETQTFTEVYDNRWPAQGSTLRLRGAQHAPIQHGDLTVTPILVHGEHSFGAEVAGVDWSKPLPQELVEQVKPPVPSPQSK